MTPWWSLLPLRSRHPADYALFARSGAGSSGWRQMQICMSSRETLAPSTTISSLTMTTRAVGSLSSKYSSVAHSALALKVS